MAILIVMSWIFSINMQYEFDMKINKENDLNSKITEKTKSNNDIPKKPEIVIERKYNGRNFYPREGEETPDWFDLKYDNNGKLIEKRNYDGRTVYSREETPF